MIAWTGSMEEVGRSHPFWRARVRQPASGADDAHAIRVKNVALIDERSEIGVTMIHRHALTVDREHEPRQKGLATLARVQDVVLHGPDEVPVGHHVISIPPTRTRMGCDSPAELSLGPNGIRCRTHRPRALCR
jgi:hypothetical protein